jgi:hypothetical protein
MRVYPARPSAGDHFQRTTNNDNTQRATLPMSLTAAQHRVWLQVQGDGAWQVGTRQGQRLRAPTLGKTCARATTAMSRKALVAVQAAVDQTHTEALGPADGPPGVRTGSYVFSWLSIRVLQRSQRAPHRSAA